MTFCIFLTSVFGCVCVAACFQRKPVKRLVEKHALRRFTPSWGSNLTRQGSMSRLDPRRLSIGSTSTIPPQRRKTASADYRVHISRLVGGKKSTDSLCFSLKCISMRKLVLKAPWGSMSPTTMCQSLTARVLLDCVRQGLPGGSLWRSWRWILRETVSEGCVLESRGRCSLPPLQAAYLYRCIYQCAYTSDMSVEWSCRSWVRSEHTHPIL